MDNLSWWLTLLPSDANWLGTREITMSDDKTNRGPADRARINIHEAYEVEYWSKELGVSRERLRDLVAKHGVLATDVRKALGK
jgi:hypothetical protein